MMMKRTGGGQLLQRNRSQLSHRWPLSNQVQSFWTNLVTSGLRMPTMQLNLRSHRFRRVDPVVDLVVVVMVAQVGHDHKAKEDVLVRAVSGAVSAVQGHDPSVDRGHGLTREAVHAHVASNDVVS